MLANRFGIAAPIWVLNPGPDTSPAYEYTTLTADSTITVDTDRITVDTIIGRVPPIQRPDYVLQQSLPPGTSVPEAPLTVIILTVIGIPVSFPGGKIQAVP